MSQVTSQSTTVASNADEDGQPVIITFSRNIDLFADDADMDADLDW